MAEPLPYEDVLGSLRWRLVGPFRGGRAEIKGQWVNVLEGWQNGFIMPNSRYRSKVIRVEFEQVELPPRVRQRPGPAEERNTIGE